MTGGCARSGVLVLVTLMSRLVQDGQHEAAASS
jgi:hypothetical protein